MIWKERLLQNQDNRDPSLILHLHTMSEK